MLRVVDLVRLSDGLLADAGALRPVSMRSLDAVHLATARALGEDLTAACTYDLRMASAAEATGMTVVAPA